jgi:hypothetical protein
MLILYNLIFIFNVICIDIYYFIVDILNIIFVNNNSFILNIILFYNKYKFIDYFCYIYINVYPIYKFFRKIIILLYFNILKLYIIFINDRTFFSLNNFLLILFFKLKKWIIYNLKFYNKRYFKWRKKYKNYYKLGKVKHVKVFFFLTLLLLFVLMWKNRTAYYRIYFLLYPVFFYISVMVLCMIIVPLFYYKFLGVIFIIFLVFMIFLLKILN